MMLTTLIHVKVYCKGETFVKKPIIWAENRQTMKARSKIND